MEADPGRRVFEPGGEQADVEDVAAVERLGLGQKVEKQGGEAMSVQMIGDSFVART
jgi:hypothetical protein